MFPVCERNETLFQKNDMFFQHLSFWLVAQRNFVCTGFVLTFCICNKTFHACVKRPATSLRSCPSGSLSHQLLRSFAESPSRSDHDFYIDSFVRWSCLFTIFTICFLGTPRWSFLFTFCLYKTHLLPHCPSCLPGSFPSGQCRQPCSESMKWQEF